MFYLKSHSYWALSTYKPPFANLSTTSTIKFSKFFLNLEGFLVGSTLVCLYSNQPKCVTQTFFLEKQSLPKMSLLLKLQIPNCGYYVVDGVHFLATTNQWVVQYNFSSMLTDNRIVLYTQVNDFQFSLPSIAHVYKSTIWLERELSDFSNLTFNGLFDTRRLLLDYFQPKQTWNTHISNERAFNNTVYEVSLNF
jgi:NADH:ubiquinone oxidoreductase subunit C